MKVRLDAANVGRSVVAIRIGQLGMRPFAVSGRGLDA
jgi:hypothetical protein